MTKESEEVAKLIKSREDILRKDMQKEFDDKLAKVVSENGVNTDDMLKEIPNHKCDDKGCGVCGMTSKIEARGYKRGVEDGLKLSKVKGSQKIVV